MLRAISLANFKAYERLEELELRPLTVFCGPNAVGKSSVIQALLMMRQTIDEDERPETWSGSLITDGTEVSLGDYIDVVFGHNLGRDLGIELTVPIAGSESYSVMGESAFWEEPVTLTLMPEYWIPYYGGAGPEPGRWEALRSRNAVPTLRRLRIAAKGTDGRELVTVELTERTIGDVDVALTFGERMGHADRYFYAPKGSFDLRRMAFTGRLIETTPAGDALEGESQSGVNFDTSGPRTKFAAFTLADWDDDCGAEELVGLVARMLDEVSSLLTVRYVGPAREVPQRYYDVDKRSMRVGAARSEHDWKADLASGSSNVRRPLDTPEAIRTYSGGLRAFTIHRGSLDETINSWLSYLDLPEVHPVLEGRDFRVMVSSPYAEDCPVSVADTGYGVSQVLPILLAGATSREEVLVFDQPELHLHPKLQTGMADFAIAVAEQRQVLVETHSDHFVNRIVRRVVEGQIDSNDVAIYFFTPTSDGPHVEMVEVDPTFGIKNWPLGFFDDYADEQEAIVRASLKRRVEEGRN